MKKIMNNRYDIGSATDPGKKRRGAPNQDSMVVLLPAKNSNLPPVFVIADGMGGYSGGSLASQIIIEQFRKGYEENKSDPFVFQDFAVTAIENALHKMQAKAQQDDQYGFMGSTIVAVSITDGKVDLANVGDSRAYLINANEMLQINYDHSFVGEAMRAGLLSQADAMKHPKKNQLTQSVTAKRSEVKPFLTSVPFAEDDLVLLCSDGLWGVVPESIIHATAIELSPQQAVKKLVKLANDYGGPDNITVILCKRAGTVKKNPFTFWRKKNGKNGLFSLFKKSKE